MEIILNPHVMWFAPLTFSIFTTEDMVDKGESEKYDFAFIDADKPNYIHYYELCMRLVRPGGIIAIDNV